MTKHLPAALFTARRYAKKYQEGGEVEQTRPPPPPPEPDPYDPLAASAGVAPAGTPTIAQIDWGQPSWLEQAAEQSRRDQEAYAREGARGMLRDTEGTQELAGGFSDTGIMGHTKGIAGVAGNVFRELPPEILSSAQKVPMKLGHAPGSQGGGFHTGFPDGRDRYIKPAKSEDHALNERLGAALYKELGVPSADVELTEINGKPHISSPQVPGVQLGASGYHPHELMDLQQGLPADQFLAGYDSIGLDQDNIIVDKSGVARRIDFGGTMRYRAQGAPKTQWGKDVTEFESFFNPNINPHAAESFVPYGKDPTIDAARKEMAGRIANLSNARIDELVGLYGPKNAAAKKKLVGELMSRRDQVAEFYGAQTPTREGGPEDSGVGYSLKDPNADAKKLVSNNDSNPREIAADMWDIAAKGEPEYVDELYKKLPPELQDDVNAHITHLIDQKGDPWSGDFHPHIGPEDIEPAPHGDWKPPLQSNSLELEHAAMDWLINAGLHPEDPAQAHYFDSPVETALQMGWEPPAPKKVSPAEMFKQVPFEGSPAFATPPANVPKVMQINKTHSPGQVVHALKDYDLATALQEPAKITPKQINKIKEIMAAKQPEALASEMAGLNGEQVTNLYSWMPQKHIDSVGDSLADLDAKGKAYHKGPDQYQKDLQEYYDKQHMTELHQHNLAIGEHAAPKSAKPGKNYTNQEWLKTLFNDIPDWSKYKLKGSHSFTPLDIPKADLAELQQEHGFNPYIQIFHSSKEFGPNKPQLYPSELQHPTEFKKNKPERAFFGSPQDYIAGSYSGKPVRFIARANKAAEFDWSHVSSSGVYNESKMHAIIEAARTKGYDLIIIKKIHDIGGGIQDQFAILNTEILRAPTANFDPTKLHKAWPLAGIAGGFLYSYGSMPGEQKPQGQMARGGKVEQKRTYTMPLKPGSSAAVKSENIREFHTGPTYAHTKAKFGKARADAQAIAVALSTARKYGKGKALGGPNLNMENMVMRGSMYGLRHEGMINSSIPGRTDKLPMKVRAGSYILPADIPSALGQGNTMAGGEILKKMFSSGPYGLPLPRGGGGGRGMRPMRIQQQQMPKKLPGTFAEGGETHEHVPIIAAGGEYIISPEVVREIGHGSIKAGHKVLDAFTLKVRKEHVATLKRLPPPKK